ncbi:MAG TPA: hypothetical protein DCP51_02870 [Clostridiales bacterium]|nr:hypothetical protein [Clostridiales bacterium]
MKNCTHSKVIRFRWLKTTSLPTHIALGTSLLAKNSIVLLEQIRTIDKIRLGKYIGKLDEKYMKGIDRALSISVRIEL